MTQEELDALMADGLDGDEQTSEVNDDILDESSQSSSNSNLETEQETSKCKDKDEDSSYRVSSTSAWPPPPPTDDHKMVRQLDDVTKDSEEKLQRCLIN